MQNNQIISKIIKLCHKLTIIRAILHKVKIKKIINDIFN